MDSQLQIGCVLLLLFNKAVCTGQVAAANSAAHGFTNEYSSDRPISAIH